MLNIASCNSIMYINTIFTVFATGWFNGVSELPRTDYGFAVGYYNNTIFLIGGMSSETCCSIDYHVVEYELHHDQFTISDLNQQPIGVRGYPQFWTQQNHIVYIIDSYTSFIGTFDLRDKQYSSHWRDIDMMTTTCIASECGCLASSTSYLYVLGGYNNNGGRLSTLQILSLSTYEWINNPPSMNTHRMNHACIVHNSFLWAFGGRDTTVLKTDERINIIDINQYSWTFIDELSIILKNVIAVALGEEIYVIGGQNRYNANVDIVHIVNGVTGNVTVSDHRLKYIVVNTGAIVVDSVIYVFGGRTGTGQVSNQWMYYINTDNTETVTMNPTSMSTSLSESPTYDLANITAQSSALSSTKLTDSTKSFTSYNTVDPSSHLPNITAQSSVVSSTKETESTTHRFAQKKPEGVNINDIWAILGLIALLCLAVTSSIFVFLYFKERRKNRSEQQLSISQQEHIGVKDIVSVIEQKQKIELVQMEPEKCTECGAVSLISKKQQEALEGKLFVCSLCKSLNDPNVNKDVNKMYDHEKCNDIQTGSETTYGELNTTVLQRQMETKKTDENIDNPHQQRMQQTHGCLALLAPALNSDA